MKISPRDTQKFSQELEKDIELELEFSKKEMIRELHSCVKVLIEKCHWGRNIGIENKFEEKQRFLRELEEGGEYVPDFQFSGFEYSDSRLLDLLDQCIEGAEKIDGEELEKYGAEVVTTDDMQRFYTDIFTELKLYVKLAAGIESEDKWRTYSEKIWPMVDREEFQKSKRRMKEIKKTEEEKNLDSSDLREMFEAEIERLGMEYSVEVRNVPGCYNIPEEKTVVVADGGAEKRYYSEEEAQMLTIHELFHSVRAYNGYKAGKNNLPPVLAIHTPFYDQAEEGGALYREDKTGVAYGNKDFDHHLRLVAAYRMAESDDLNEEFHSIAEDIIEIGAEPERVFELMARNREVLRHHIYKSGHREWRNLGEDEIRSMLIGKINYRYAELFGKEVEADGMLRAPEIGPEKLFDFTFKDSE